MRIRELRQPRRYRLLAKPPLTVSFPSVVYAIDYHHVTGAPVWELRAVSLSGSPEWKLCHNGSDRAWLERDLFESGFELLHPTAASAIMEKLVEQGRAERLPWTEAERRRGEV